MSYKSITSLPQRKPSNLERSLSLLPFPSSVPVPYLVGKHCYPERSRGLWTPRPSGFPSQSVTVNLSPFVQSHFYSAVLSSLTLSMKVDSFPCLKAFSHIKLRLNKHILLFSYKPDFWNQGANTMTLIVDEERCHSFLPPHLPYIRLT